jgi:energy-coupling factor transport system ATP-binding protein
MKPETLIVDEPTTGQDMRQSYEVMEILKRLNIEGKTVIFITHNMRLVAEYAKRSVIMNNGRIIMDGPTAEVFNNFEVLSLAQLKPPQVTVLASKLVDRFKESRVLNVDDFLRILRSF